MGLLWPRGAHLTLERPREPRLSAALGDKCHVAVPAELQSLPCLAPWILQRTLEGVGGGEGETEAQGPKDRWQGWWGWTGPSRLTLTPSYFYLAAKTDWGRGDPAAVRVFACVCCACTGARVCACAPLCAVRACVHVCLSVGVSGCARRPVSVCARVGARVRVHTCACVQACLSVCTCARGCTCWFVCTCVCAWAPPLLPAVLSVFLHMFGIFCC